MKSFNKDKLIKFIEVTYNIKHEVKNCDWVDSYKQSKYLQAFNELINACFYISNKEFFDMGSELELHMQRMNIKVVKDQGISGELLWNEGILRLAIKCFEKGEV